MARPVDKDRARTQALAESKALLDRCEFHGLMVKEIADILDLSDQRVSDYRRAARTGTGSAIPRNNRKVLAEYLDRLDRKAGDAERKSYPSERAAEAHQEVEHLARLTDAQGPWWEMYVELARSVIKQVEGARHDRSKEARDGSTGEGQTDAPNG